LKAPVLKRRRKPVVARMNRGEVWVKSLEVIANSKRKLIDSS
jgi:hypothetical protein